jgi:hypothetical protein
MDLNEIGSSLITGGLIHMAPSIIKGMMKEYLGQIKTADFIMFVQTDANLWNEFGPEYQNILLQYAPKFGRMEWFTAEWAMEAGRQSAPAIYSLITGWPEAKEWLNRQIIDLKTHIKEKQNVNRSAAPVRAPQPNPALAEDVRPVPGVREPEQARPAIPSVSPGNQANTSRLV